MIKTWEDLYHEEKNKEYNAKLKAFLFNEAEAGKEIYPPPSLRYRAFTTTPLEDVKVVIVGQDPYHGEGEADGLAFSTRGKKIPPSLRNIFAEIEGECGARPETGDLTYLAKQGVLLINSVLTVEANLPGSHRERGWEQFTDAVLKAVAERNKPTVVMLWGLDAQKKAPIFKDHPEMLVLKAPHPSPFSARRGFFRCGHFNKANEYLKTHGLKEVDWTGRNTKPDADFV